MKGKQAFEPMKIRQLITSTLFALIFGLMAPMGAALANTAEETFAKAVAAVTI